MATLSRRALLVLVAALVAAGPGCAAEPVAPPEPPPERPPRLVVADPLLADLGADLLAAAGFSGRPAVQDEARAYASLLRGDADCVLALRPPSEDEQRLARGDDLVEADPLVAEPIAKDDLLLVVPMSLGVDGIGLTDAAELLGGARRTWQGLGASVDVTLFVPPRGSGAWAVVASLPGDPGPPASAEWQSDDATIVRRVREAEGGALGLASRSVVRGVRPLVLRGEQTHHPDAGAWPLRRSVLFVSRGAPTRRAGSLLEAARSDAGTAAIAARGFLPPEAP